MPLISLARQDLFRMEEAKQSADPFHLILFISEQLDKFWPDTAV
jgi:hypothetical protein